ncbi:alpha-2-macroglobulin family protein [Fusobacterium perfoetens]|uniref:alpha-2-macroglobulin family protein n=1 Tax=Fusobacterium perfoetens TaxID=852 RepID=UPI000489DEC8|nr:MG2 domain-containing protein [Fusobacterium perfoetens]
MKKLLYILILIFMFGCGKEKEPKKNNITENTSTKIETTVEETSDKTENQINESYLKINDVITISGEKSRINIEFSENLEENKDFSAYIKISPEVSHKVLKDKNKLIIIGDFNLKDTYTIKILKEINSVTNKTLKENIEKSINFKELEPKIVFSNDGIILPSTNNQKISFKSINVKKVKVQVKKVYENNLTQFLQDFVFEGNGSVLDWRTQSEFYKVGDSIFEKEFDIDYKKNIWTQSEIELSNLINNKGIFILELSFDKDGIDYTFPENTPEYKKNNLIYNNGKIGKALLLSDMGIIAQKDKDNTIVNVVDLLTNSIIKNAKIKVISENNQILYEGVTNENGDYIFPNNEKAFYIIAENNNQISILKFRDSNLSFDGFAVEGIYTTTGIKTFMYTDRGIYRPGDEVNLSIIARNNHKTFPENHPVIINVYSPRGKKIVENYTISDGKNGFYTYNFKTNLDGETGIYRIEALIGSESFVREIPIETITPNKIKVETKIPKELNLKNKRDLEFSLSSQYLFGAVADNLKFTSDIQIREENINFEKFRNFTFDDPTSYDFYYGDFFEGKLNEKGIGNVKFNLNNLNPKNKNLIGIVTTRVMETNGKPVISKESIKLNKFDSYIGLEIPKDTFIKSGDKLNLQVITVSNDGEKYIPNKKLVYRIYKNEYSWWWDYGSYYSFVKSIKTDKNTVLLYEKEFISEDRPYIIDYPIDGTGEIFVEVEDLETKQTVGLNLYADTWQNSNTNKKIDKLKIESDKKIYNIGDKAKVIFEGTEKSKALITVEKSGKIIKRVWKDIDSLKNEFELEITEDMFPNSYVVVSLFQDYNKDNDRPLRLYGAVPIIVENNNTKLNISIDVPTELKPNEKFTVKVKNQEKIPMDYTIAIVDEGILNITNFQTPNPWNFFYQKEALLLSFYDNYSEIIEKTKGEIHQVLQTGGDGFVNEMAGILASKRDKNLGLEDVQRFKPLAIYKGILSTDESGEGSVDFVMPNYMGAVKVMVVGASKDKYGSIDKEIIVKAPIVVEASLPRTLKVGDEIMIPVTVFGLEENIGEVEVKFTIDGKTQKEIITLQNKENKKIFFKENIGNKIGNKNIKISVSSKVYNYEEDINININSDSPYIYINDIEELSKDKEISFTEPKEAIKGSVNKFITISNSPILALNERINYLTRYPYGWAEQIASNLFAQLYLDSLTIKGEYDEKEVVKNINSGITKLVHYQLYDGSFSYWIGGKTDLWLTNYIGHFLIEAKSKGYYIPEQMYNKWLDFTKKSVKSYDSLPLDWKVYSLYLLALADSPEISEMNLIYENYFQNSNELDIRSKWYLANAYKLVGEDNLAKEMSLNLNRDIKPRDAREYIDSNSSYIKDMSIVLKAYYDIYNEMDRNLYNKILGELQSNKWLSTESIGYSLMTIAKVSGKEKTDEVKGIISINNKDIEFSTENGIFKYDIPNDVTDIKVKSLSDKIFINHYWEGIPVNYQMEDISKNIKLERKYFDEKGQEINPNILTSGDSFWLQIKVLPIDIKSSVYVDDVVLTQILPTGWEIENLRATNTPLPQWINILKGDTTFEYEDIRDDRVLWFFDFYSERENSFFIKVNVTSLGKFTFPGTTVEAINNENYKGYLKGFTVEVK